MRHKKILSGIVAVVLVSIAFSSQARDVKAARAQDAQSWLKKIQTAAQRLNYSGTFVYQQGGEVRTSRITHVNEGGSEVEKLEILDGKPREYIRNNDDIVYYIPEAKTLLTEKRVTKEVFPALLATTENDLTAHYRINQREEGRVAGFACQVLSLEPKDRLRYGYRLWAERKSGLLLRAQTLDDAGKIVEQISFTQLSIGSIDRSRVKPSIANTAGWRVENAVMSAGHFSRWEIKSLPPGFRKIREVRRLVSDTAAAPGKDGKPSQREVSQIVFSDGLAAISVFIEPAAGQGRPEGLSRQGAMNVLGKRQGDFWLTIVGEVPAAAIRQVANSVEFK
ncbi:MAG: rseB [Paucimonas sp.]|jgi:sigma-E factor negative regulatory protein RseB|nr:rseB [Paucimonas sp.]